MSEYNRYDNNNMQNDRDNSSEISFKCASPQNDRQPPRRPSGKRPVKKKNNTGTKVAVIGAVLVLLCGSVAIAAAAGVFGSKSQPAAAESSVASTESSAASEPEESEESTTPQPSFQPTGEFKADLNKFPSDVRQTLTDEITSRFVVLYDATADKVLFQKNGTDKCYPASTTKIMTAVVSSQILDKDDVITVGDEIKLINWDSSTAGLVKGMKLTYEMLLDALLLPSGNDAAYTIAVNSAKKYTGDDTLSDEEAVKIFMGLVNEALQDIGCKNTHYVTPDGWHDDDHYTTATDLAKMGAYAKTIDIVNKSMSKYSVSYELLNAQDESSEEESSESSESSEESSEGEDEEYYDDDEEEEFVIPDVYDPDFFGTTIGWTNTNAIINPDSEYFSKYADGIKTGYTDEAGTSVVCSATMEGHTMVAVCMMGVSMYAKYEDANKLFDEAFKLYDLDYTYGIQYDE